MINIVKFAFIALVVILFGFSLVQNVIKISEGCPAGQILIKSVSTYECVRR